MEKKKDKKIIKIIAFLGVLFILFGTSYALFQVTLNGTKKLKMKTGNIKLELLDSNNNPIYITNQNNTTTYEINIESAAPTTDQSGLVQEGFTFKLKNTGYLSSTYTIYLDDVALETGEDRMADKYIRYSLTKNNEEAETNYLTRLGTAPNRRVDYGLINRGEVNTYTLKVWLAEDADNDAMGKVFNTTLRVEGEQFISPYEEGSFADQLLKKDYVGVLNAPVQNGFNETTREISGLYKYTDTDNKTTYVYRGLPEDNLVDFAGRTWKIIRIQDDGTVKLIVATLFIYLPSSYNSSAIHTGFYGTKVTYNYNCNTDECSKYSGSTVEGYINAWYQDKLSDYNDIIADATYCSDRYEPAEPSLLRQSDFPTWTHLYGLYNRGEKVGDTYRWSPSVSCNSNDEVNAKAALITMDEYIIACGKTTTTPALNSSKCYLDNSTLTYPSSWTMSPAGFDSSNPIVFKFGNQTNSKSSSVGSVDNAVRPVITLKADVIPTSGDGSGSNKYTFE